MPRTEVMTTTPGLGTGWIDHAAARTVMEELRHLLAVSRMDPIPWQPIPILFGEPGVGKTAICDRFVEESRIVEDAPSRYPTVSWPVVKMVMPIVCDHDHIGRAIHSAMHDLWGGEGERRTTMLLIEDADRLLDLSRVRRNAAVACLRVRWARFLPVLVGSRELARVLAVEMRFDPIPLPPLPPGPEFASAVASLSGALEAVDLGRLHGETGGIIGRLLAMARRGGLGRPTGGAASLTPPLPR